jgi:hypothetical protein
MKVLFTFQILFDQHVREADGQVVRINRSIGLVVIVVVGDEPVWHPGEKKFPRHANSTQ